MRTESRARAHPSRARGCPTCLERQVKVKGLVLLGTLNHTDGTIRKDIPVVRAIQASGRAADSGRTAVRV